MALNLALRTHTQRRVLNPPSLKYIWLDIFESIKHEITSHREETNAGALCQLQTLDIQTTSNMPYIG
jgi:hypothetical protein